MPLKATFSSHSIRLDGLHIFSVTDEGVEIETIIAREDAVMFGWIASDDGIEDEEEYIGSEYMRNVKRERDMQKLEAWNALAKESAR